MLLLRKSVRQEAAKKLPKPLPGKRRPTFWKSSRSRTALPPSQRNGPMRLSKHAIYAQWLMKKTSGDSPIYSQPLAQLEILSSHLWTHHS